RPNSRRRLQAKEVFFEWLALLEQRLVEERDLIAGHKPHRMVSLDAGSNRVYDARDQLLPSRLRLAVPTLLTQTRRSQDVLGGAHLGALQAHEVTALSQCDPQALDRRWRHVHDRAVDIATQPLTDLVRIPAVALLPRPVSLQPHLV